MARKLIMYWIYLFSMYFMKFLAENQAAILHQQIIASSPRLWLSSIFIQAQERLNNFSNCRGFSTWKEDTWKSLACILSFGEAKWKLQFIQHRNINVLVFRYASLSIFGQLWALAPKSQYSHTANFRCVKFAFWNSKQIYEMKMKALGFPKLCGLQIEDFNLL